MLAAKTGAWKCQISGPPPILSLYRVAHFLLAAEIFPQFISATWGFNGTFRPKVCLLCFGGIYAKCGCEGKGRGGWLGPSVPWRRRLSWGTRTHLALMLLGCPAVRVRGTTRPHPFKASPGKRPCWKPRLSMREEPHFFIFSPFVPPPTKAQLICAEAEVQTQHYHWGWWTWRQKRSFGGKNRVMRDQEKIK